MSNQPWISIIVPAYNAEQSIKQMISSVLKQTFERFELIIVDDGSIDATNEICKEYSANDNRVSVLKVENGGPFRARLIGAKHASGEYITFCDADDYYINNSVFKLLNKQISLNPCDILQFGFRKKYNHLYRKISSVKKKEFINEECFNRRDYPKLLCSYWDASHLTVNVWNKIYQRRLLESVPDSYSTERIFWGDDLIMNLFLLEHCSSILYIPNALYVYNQLTGGTNTFSKRTMKDLNQIKVYQQSFLYKQKREDEPEIERVLFSELACWFLDWVSEGLKRMPDNQMERLVEDTLSLPAFQQARQYYYEHPQYNWQAFELLKKNDPKEYIKVAKSIEYKPVGIKGRIKEKIIQLYKAI